MDISLENRDKIIALLKEGICPICGKQYKVPLSHINKSHGISKQELKDTLLLRQCKGFASEDARKGYSKIGKENWEKKKSGLIPGGHRKKHDGISKEKIRLQCRIATKKRYTERPDHLKAFLEGQKRSVKKAVQASVLVTQKPVVRVSETGEIKHYKSISDAAKENSISTSNISRCVNGEYRTVGGYFWGTLDNIPTPQKIINTKSGIKGVSWCNSRKKWAAHIWHNGKGINLGRFDNMEDAIKAREEAEEKYKK